MRAFDLSDILTVTTDRLLSSRGMDGVYDILNYLTGDDLYTHQLPRALRACGPWILVCYPALADAGPSWPEGAATSEVIAEYLAAQKAIHGDALELAPLPPGVWRRRDPLGELIEMRGGDAESVIIVEK